MVYIDSFIGVNMKSLDVDLRDCIDKTDLIIDFDDLKIYTRDEYKKPVRKEDVLNLRIDYKFGKYVGVFTFAPNHVKLVRLGSLDAYLYFSAHFVEFTLYKEGYLHNGFMAILGKEGSKTSDTLIDCIGITPVSSDTRRPDMLSAFYVERKPEKAISLSTFKRSLLLV